MKRRDAIKKIGAIFGALAALPFLALAHKEDTRPAWLKSDLKWNPQDHTENVKMMYFENRLWISIPRDIQYSHIKITDDFSLGYNHQ